MSLHIVILAAGQGTRMQSQTPKVLHPIAGKPMLARVIDVAQELNPAMIHIIYGYGGEQIKQALPNPAVNWIKQEQLLGTGHAVLQALPFIPPESQVLILSGDVPLIQLSTLSTLIALTQPSQSLALLLAKIDNPTGLGRIIRNTHGHIVAIVEEKDANTEQKAIQEIYSGICSASASDLAKWLPQLQSNNAQGEYYLTDIIALAVKSSVPIVSLAVDDIMEIQGVNTRIQLQQLERLWQHRCAERLMLSGVTLADASRIDIRGELHCGQDVFIDSNNLFIGQVVLGKNCRIDPNCTLTNVSLGDNCHILANSVLEGCQIGDNCHIGPFARLRPATVLANNCKIGNFVETKNAQFGAGSKASHLSYLGDVSLGKQVNIGAGTITCNYDGVNKHQTTIEDGVFVGSDTQFVAPVTIGAHATIGAGSTIRKNVPPGELTLTESRQKTIVGWKRPVKKDG